MTPAIAELEHQRVDRWLWHARFLKSRALATSFAQSGKLRINRERVQKASRQLRLGDVLTFPQGTRIRVVKVLAFATRRGTAAQAQSLYENLDVTPHA